MFKKVMIMLIPISLGLSGCVTTPVYAPTTSCSQLVPDELRAPTANAAAPQLGADVVSTLNNWISFALRQTDQKLSADERKDVALGVIERCEERDREAIRKANRGFLGL